MLAPKILYFSNDVDVRAYEWMILFLTSHIFVLNLFVQLNVAHLF